MRWLIVAVIVVAVVGLWTLREPEPAGAPPPLPQAPEAAAEGLFEPSLPQQAPDPSKTVEAASGAREGAPDRDADGVINIGEPMDPDDPSTWPQPENTEVINIGEPMDPDDPSTWPQPENTEVINIGEPMDPDDPSTWPQPENTEVINIGEPMDPDDPSTWPQRENTEVINIGEPMDPDDPSTWP